MTTAEPVRRRSRRRPSFELSINGTVRQVPADSASDSDSSMDAVLQPIGNAAAAAERGSQGRGSPSKQHKHVCDLEQERHQHISAQEWGNMALLVLLYAMQGIPLGLTMGAM
jgi:K+-transporting ATPase c subunit